MISFREGRKSNLTPLKHLISVCMFFFSYSIRAAEYTETFNDRSVIESGDLIFNQALGSLHPQLFVMNFKIGFDPLEVLVGDGSDGVFDTTTYARFSQNGDLSGNIIRLDTNEFPELNVTRFFLAKDWILEPVGSAPLIIKSLTDVIIEGEILCNGLNGEDAVNATIGNGGQGRCGGFRGGNGGAPFADGENGLSPFDPTVTGGQGGNYPGLATPAVSGGGGGGWNTSSLATDGTNFSMNGGQAGATDPDPEFINELGSGGGGGGSGTDSDAGAGGGGGGGMVRIFAVRDFILGRSPLSVFGSIHVNGGEGGSSNVQGGAGGGGAGGSVSVFVGRNIEIFNTDGAGASQANSASGGTNVNLDSGGSGGIGRSWFSSVGYNLNGTGFYTPAEDAPISPGNVEFTSNAQELITRSIDLRTTQLQINNVLTTPVSADFQIQLSGSDSQFQSDQTPWTTNLNELRGKRYIKIKAIITSSDVNAGSFLEAVTIDYTPGSKSDFDFVSSSCGRVNSNKPFNGGYLILMLPFLLILFLRFKFLNAIF